MFLSTIVSLPAPSSISVVFPGKISAASAFASSRSFVAESAAEAAAATVLATVPLQIVSRPSFPASEGTVCVQNSFRFQSKRICICVCLPMFPKWASLRLMYTGRNVLKALCLNSSNFEWMVLACVPLLTTPVFKSSSSFFIACEPSFMISLQWLEVGVGYLYCIGRNMLISTTEFDALWKHNRTFSVDSLLLYYKWSGRKMTEIHDIIFDTISL